MALSETALAFAQNVKFRGPLEGSTHYGQAGSPGDGPYFQLWLIISCGAGSQRTVLQAAYQSHGCPSSMAVGGMLCAIITGRELAKVKELTPDDVKALVGPLPEGKEFNYHLAAKALRSLKE
jgi:NifU-like protein involved in Fe-S cluster formation